MALLFLETIPNATKAEMDKEDCITPRNICTAKTSWQ
jgi:hypothetical protein